ncbi:MAG: hypothetical protein WCS65_04745 [Verrucomicrobiae bacterium]
MTPEENISKIIRLKRYEQPPAGYFEGFLQEFQSRQNADFARPTFWEIVRDRASSLEMFFQAPRLAYAAVAAALAVAAVTFSVLPASRVSGNLADVRQPLTLASPQQVTIGGSLPVVMPVAGSPSVQYVLPASPASYASSRSF